MFAAAKSKRKLWYHFTIILVVSIIVIVNIFHEEKEDSSIKAESINSNKHHDHVEEREKIEVDGLDTSSQRHSSPQSISDNKEVKENALAQPIVPTVTEKKSQDEDLPLPSYSSKIATARSIPPTVTKMEGNITQISVLGERHCGTTWIYDHLTKCFGKNLFVARHLTRYKHWFQFDDGLDHNKTLAISLFRNPYYWVTAMVSIPHHSPMHIGLDWKTFVTTPWTMPRIGKDLNVTNRNERICQDSFHYNEIISCIKRPYPDGYFDTRPKPKYSGHQPYYELKQDGSGEPYNSIIELRTAKIMNFFEMKNYSFVHDYWPLRYEELLRSGTDGLLEEIERVTGVKRECEAFGEYEKSKRGLDDEFVQWMNENLDWGVEGLIGYERVENASQVAASPWLF